ncbi:MAG: hypothetical protein K2G88_01195 [Oscillospiraceae bacterium]|nr:hypothetical protein [Oscillospiraceae bacterium]
MKLKVGEQKAVGTTGNVRVKEWRFFDPEIAVAYVKYKGAQEVWVKGIRPGNTRLCAYLENGYVISCDIEVISAQKGKPLINRRYANITAASDNPKEFVNRYYHSIGNDMDISSELELQMSN